MALFTWDRVYSVGNEEIDQQHQKLFDIANNFADACKAGCGQAVLGTIFDQLIDYTRVHFAYEEEMLEQMKYPDFQRHKANHEKLLGLVMNYREQFRGGEKDVQERVLAFLKTWLDGHICGMDRRYSSHINTIASQQSHFLPTRPIIN